MQTQTNKIRYSIDTEVIPLNVEKEVNEHTKTDNEREKKREKKQQQQQQQQQQQKRRNI